MWVWQVGVSMVGVGVGVSVVGDGLGVNVVRSGGWVWWGRGGSECGCRGSMDAGDVG